jgi:CBS domain-containing protein
MAERATLRDVVTVEEGLAIRRIPVVEPGRSVGLVSLGDLAMAFDRASALGKTSAAPPSPTSGT